MSHRVGIIVVNLQPGRFVFRENDSGGPETVSVYEVVFSPSPACRRHEIGNRSESMAVAYFFQSGEPITERFRIEIKRRFRPLAGDFNPCVKVALAEKIAPRMDSDKRSAGQEALQNQIGDFSRGFALPKQVKIMPAALAGCPMASFF